jgi:hypothetical protein
MSGPVDAVVARRALDLLLDVAMDNPERMLRSAARANARLILAYLDAGTPSPRVALEALDRVGVDLDLLRAAINASTSTSTD